MADNLNIDEGSTLTVATDDISGVHYQVIKIAEGGLDTANIVSGANPLPVAVTSGTVTLSSTIVTVDNTVAVSLSTTKVTVDNQPTVSLSDTKVTVDNTVTVSLTSTEVTIGNTPSVSLSPTVVTVQASAVNPLSVTVTDGTISLSSTAVTIDNQPTVSLSSTAVTIDNQPTVSLSSTAVTVENTPTVSLSSTAVTVDNNLTLAAGTNLAADVGISGARTTGGTTIFRDIDVDETAAGSQVKSGAGQVYWMHAMNLGSGVRYLKFYNSITVTVGTTTPVLTFAIPTQGDTNGAGFALAVPNGIAFGTGITVAATTGVADNNSGAPGANEVVLNLGYA